MFLILALAALVVRGLPPYLLLLPCNIDLYVKEDLIAKPPECRPSRPLFEGLHI